MLGNAGKISKKQADEKAREEYDQFKNNQRTQLEAEQETHCINELKQIAKTPKDQP